MFQYLHLANINHTSSLKKKKQTNSKSIKLCTIFNENKYNQLYIINVKIIFYT